MMPIQIKFTDEDKEDAFRLRQEIKILRASATENFFRLGEKLKEVRDRELWRMNNDTFESYLADPEIAIKRSSGYHAIKLVETFPEWDRLVEVPVSKLIMIAPHVTEDTKKELLADAEALSRSDLGYKLKSEGKIVPVVADGIPLPKIYRCDKCKLLKNIRWEDLCHCGLNKQQVEHISKLLEAVEFGDDLGVNDDYEDEEENYY